MSLTKSDGGASVAPGGTVSYTLTYANGGNQGASGVVLTDVVPANTTFNAGASSDDLPLPGNAYAWDLDNDGQFDDGAGSTASTTFSSSGGKTVRLRVTDNRGETDTSTIVVTV